MPEERPRFLLGPADLWGPDDWRRAWRHQVQVLRHAQRQAGQHDPVQPAAHQPAGPLGGPGGTSAQSQHLGYGRARPPAAVCRGQVCGHPRANPAAQPPGKDSRTGSSESSTLTSPLFDGGAAAIVGVVAPAVKIKNIFLSCVLRLGCTNWRRALNWTGPQRRLWLLALSYHKASPEAKHVLNWALTD